MLLEATPFAYEVRLSGSQIQRICICGSAFYKGQEEIGTGLRVLSTPSDRNTSVARPKWCERLDHVVRRIVFLPALCFIKESIQNSRANAFIVVKDRSLRVPPLQ